MRYNNNEEFDFGPALEYIESVSGDSDLSYAMESMGDFEIRDEFDEALEALALEGLYAYENNDYAHLYAVIEEFDEVQDIANDDEKKLRRKQRLKKAAKIGAGLTSAAVALYGGNKLHKHIKSKKVVSGATPLLIGTPNADKKAATEERRRRNQQDIVGSGVITPDAPTKNSLLLGPGKTQSREERQAARLAPPRVAGLLPEVSEFTKKRKG